MWSRTTDSNMRDARCDEKTAIGEEGLEALPSVLRVPMSDYPSPSRRRLLFTVEGATNELGPISGLVNNNGCSGRTVPGPAGDRV
ncbi:hypothetical protein NPX13_g7719 [Xylaria arbuscula]|uniref:Uncharacterized protein n=1 Tax=Xylaria arbuscula TaxID=114810 RepID=A0A9W8NA07_9PEZI|nr:hypothetical protein NPX13_g7719 [Xylaria arbuscula]